MTPSSSLPSSRLSIRSAAAVLGSTLILAGVLAGSNAVRAQNASKTASDGIYSNEQAKRGQATYVQACSTCHQADLSGSDQAPALVGGDFLDRWDGQSIGDLVDRVRTTMPADNVGSLNTASSTDIVAYVLQANNFPAGSQELAPDRTSLKTVMIKKK